MSIAARVVQRFQKSARLPYEKDKFLGRDCRLSWSDHGFTLEELPIKGKKKLRKAYIQNPGTHRFHDWGAFIPENIIQSAALSASDSYDTISFKIIVAYRSAAEEAIAKQPDLANQSWITSTDWSEETVHYMKVVPENTEEFVAQAADFKVKVSWTEFNATHYYGDTENSQEPSYTSYVSSAPTSARKLYQILKANPNALKAITWDKFDEWLKANKINYKMHFSQWH